MVKCIRSQWKQQSVDNVGTDTNNNNDKDDNNNDVITSTDIVQQNGKIIKIQQ